MNSPANSKLILTPVPGIYQIRNTVNGRVYIGSSVNIAQRVWGHQRALLLGRHTNPHLQADWRAYGAEDFAFEVVEITEDSHAALDAAERRCIAEAQRTGLAYNSPVHPGRSRSMKRQRSESEKK